MLKYYTSMCYIYNYNIYLDKTLKNLKSVISILIKYIIKYYYSIPTAETVLNLNYNSIVVSTHFTEGNK